MRSSIYISQNSTLASALSTLLTILEKSLVLQEECNNLQSNVQAFLNQSVPILSNFTSMAYACEAESISQGPPSYPVLVQSMYLQLEQLLQLESPESDYPYTIAYEPVV